MAHPRQTDMVCRHHTITLFPLCLLCCKHMTPICDCTVGCGACKGRRIRRTHSAFTSLRAAICWALLRCWRQYWPAQQELAGVCILH